MPLDDFDIAPEGRRSRLGRSATSIGAGLLSRRHRGLGLGLGLLSNFLNNRRNQQVSNAIGQHYVDQALNMPGGTMSMTPEAPPFVGARRRLRISRTSIRTKKTP
jgi:hypothetical protein